MPEAPRGGAVVHVFALAEKPGRVVWAGAERHLRLLLPALAGRGTDVEAIVLATDPGPVVEEGLAEWRAAGVAVRVIARRSLGGRLANLPGFVAQHLRLLWELRRRRDRVVHLHLDLVFMMAVALLARCPRIVFTLHNEEPRPSFRPLRWLQRAWLGFVAPRLYGCIAISERASQHFATLSGLGRERIRVIEYGLELTPAAPVAREDFGWARDGFLVGFVGRLVLEKNVFCLLEAARLCPELGFVLIGEGPLRPQIESFLAARGIRNVRLAGGVENAGALIPLFDVLCLPSYTEGLGLVLVEAMLQRVPAVGSRGGAIPDVLGHGQYGLLFETESPEDLARALRAAHQRPDEMHALAERAHAYARARFSVASMVERTLAVYERRSPSGAVASTLADAAA